MRLLGFAASVGVHTSGHAVSDHLVPGATSLLFERYVKVWTKVQTYPRIKDAEIAGKTSPVIALLRSYLTGVDTPLVLAQAA
jgi:hypothetical protein